MRRSSWALAVALLCLAAQPAAGAGRIEIEVLSNRADIVSDGDALVAVKLPKGARPSKLRLRLGKRNVTSQFAVRPNGRFEGLLRGLREGRNALTARLPDGSGARLVITNHPNGGPVFSGPQVQPWVCQETAVDEQCNQPVAYDLLYKPSLGGDFVPYDPSDPPQDVATTTTDEGVEVPYVVRVETGYQNRDQYKVAVLFDPGQQWEPWAPQKGWNRKLLITHGASCGIDHRADEAPDVMNETALSRGFAVMSTALNNAGHNCNIITQAESMVMAKERLVEQYGEIRYTIGTGCSGGSLTQQQVANAYPGLYDGILPQCSFPDAWSTGNQLADYHQLRLYLENPAKWGPGLAWGPLEIAAAEGHPNHLNAIILDSLYFTATSVPSNPCAGVSDEERWSQDNPRGVRCTLADYMVNVMDTRPEDGYAGRPIDNVGVQYGLQALLDGAITPAQFVDLNVKVGGADINSDPIPEREEADHPALLNAYRSGGINTASNLDEVAIIDLRGSDDGAFHDAYRAFSVRARLDREHGTHGNHVIWQGPVPLLGQTDFVELGILAMDRWLAAVESDRRDVPRSRKIRDNRPEDVFDKCTDGLGGTVVVGTDCPAIVRVYETPRIVAGESIVTDTNKCQLKPLRREDYGPVAFSDEQWAQLEATFPGGVCDWSKPGVSAVDSVPWMTYADKVGGRPLGRPPRSDSFGCLSARAAIRRRAIGRVRLRIRRSRLLRRVPGPTKKTARSWRWCLKGARGRVAAAFTLKGRIALVGTSARRHRRRAVQSYPGRRALGAGLFQAGPDSSRVVGTRGGRVRFVAVASPRLIARPRQLRRYLRLAGLAR